MTNPVRRQNRVEHATSLFREAGVLMYHDQRKIYQNIGKHIPMGHTVLDAGCGIGTGSAILTGHSKEVEYVHAVTGIDVDTENVRFARELYPMVTFYARDVSDQIGSRYDYVACVEVLEHLEESKVEAAIYNLVRAATYRVWLSTPNRRAETPKNPFHVREYDVVEMSEKIWNAVGQVPVVRDAGWNIVSLDTKADPVVYELDVRRRS